MLLIVKECEVVLEASFVEELKEGALLATLGTAVAFDAYEYFN